MGKLLKAVGNNSAAKVNQQAIVGGILGVLSIGGIATFVGMEIARGRSMNTSVLNFEKSDKKRGKLYQIDWKAKFQLDRVSKRHRLTALLLCIFLGSFGVHRFYVGKRGWALLWLFTLGLFGIGWIVDLINIAGGKFRDNTGAVVTVWRK